MFTPKKWFFILRAVFLIALAFLGFSAYAKASDFKKPPFRQAFDLSEVGKITELKVEVNEKRKYSLDVVFYVRRPNKYFGFLDKQESIAEDAKLRNILGAAKLIAPGQWIEPGIPAKFHTRIFKESNNNELLNGNVKKITPGPTYMGYRAEIFEILLEPGRYVIKIEYIHGDPQLYQIPADFLLEKSYYGK
jgi:hypothetical protein